MSQVEDHVINGCKPINDVELTTYSAESTEQRTINGESRETNGRFLAGAVSNPLGRPKGSRNKLSEQFLNDMHDTWMQATESEGKDSTVGRDVCLKVATAEPAKMLAAMVQVLPRDFQINVDIDQVTWVINASPQPTALEWQQKHKLIDSEGTTIDEP